MLCETATTTFPLDEPPTIAQLLYSPTGEIPPEARKKVEEERAVLEAMTQSSLPVSPYLGPTGIPNWVNTPYTVPDPRDESFQLGTHVPLGFEMEMGGNGGRGGLTMEEFPSLDEIICSMEGMEGPGKVGGFGFLDDMGLFEVPS